MRATKRNDTSGRAVRDSRASVQRPRFRPQRFSSLGFAGHRLSCPARVKDSFFRQSKEQVYWVSYEDPLQLIRLPSAGYLWSCGAGGTRHVIDK